MLLSFDTKNQIITRTDANRAIANSTDYFEVSVTFSANWNGYDKTICFKNGDTEINIMLVNNAVPKEAHLNLGVGTWKVSIIGIKGNHKILTNAVNLPVGASGYIGTTGPTPRVYEELLTIIQSLHTEVASEAALRSAVEQFVDENFHDIVISDVYSKSEIDSMIVTKTVNDLVYYWNKSQTYNRAEIEALIEAAIQGTYIVTQTLPTTDISTHAIYLVPKESATVGDYYDEYINTTGTSAGWEHIGTTEIDLSNYYTKAEINALLDNKVDKVSGKGLSTNDYDNTAKSIVDGVTSALANKVDKETGKGLSTNDYDNTAKGIVDGVTAALAGKVDKETGKGLSTNDYDNTEKAKLAGIAENATKTEGSLVNGNIKINGTETKVYDDSEIKQDLSTSTTTVEGNPLNFSTLTAQKANETVISLEPIQDLHGYDHPWPEGGGKNLIPMTVDAIKAANTGGTWSGNTYTINSVAVTIQTNDGNNVIGILVNGTNSSSSDSIYFKLCDSISTIKFDGTYTLNGCTGGESTTYRMQVYGVGNHFVNNYSGDTAIQASSFAEESVSGVYITIRPSAVLTNVLFQPMIRLASETDATFAPYSNICPIDGRTETSLVGCGKNLFDKTNITTGYKLNNDGSLVQSSNYFVSGYIPLIQSMNYFVNNMVGYNIGYSVAIFDKNKNFVRIVEKSGTHPVDISFTPQNGECYVRISSLNTYLDTIQLEIAPQATAYEPFVQSNNLTIQFGETVYGATLTMETGELVVNRAYIRKTEFDYKSSSASNYIYRMGTINKSDIKNISNTISDKFKYKYVFTMNESAFYINEGTVNDEIYVGLTLESGADTLAKANTWLTNNGGYVDFCYELATPRTIQLTPNEISLLSGVNVISTDADGITLTYRDGKVATLGDLDSLNVAFNDALQDTTTDLSEDITTAQNTANTALAYAQNKVYGMRIRESVESNPASIISYLADAVGMTPVHMDYTNNVFDYGSWEDAWFIKDCKPCILGQDGVVQAYLNKNDYTKDIYGNTVTIDENLTGANVMIEFPKIWYKIVPVVPTCCDADVFISPVKLDDDYKDFAYIAQDKTHKEHFYLPAYNGSIINDGTNDVLRSLSGQAVGNSKTGTVEIEMAQRNGTGWYTETFSQVTLINLLLMLIGKSTDTQTVFGRGIDTGSQTAFDAYRTGAGNTKGMFWGSNDGTQLVKVFGIENWWSLQWRRFAGLMCVNGSFRYKMCWGQEDGSTTDNYNTDASGYIESPSTAPSGTSGGYISRMFFTSVNMLMSVVSGSSSTKYCDGGWFNNSATTYAFHGGSSNVGAFCGAFALNVNYAVSIAYWIRGAALSYT